MNWVALGMVTVWSVAGAVAPSLASASACPDDDKKPSIVCPDDDKKPSIVCPDDDKKPSNGCPDDDKKPSAF